MPAIIMSALWRLNSSDLIKSVAVAVIVAFLGALEQALTAHGFSVMSYDWGGILNVAILAGLGYITKNFATDSNGKLLGRI